ncbi:hypothetical protein [Buchnera aphidicola]|nr:hypothetical protein [Buchnera aphidicola]
MQIILSTLLIISPSIKKQKINNKLGEKIDRGYLKKNCLVRK